MDSLETLKDRTRRLGLTPEQLGQAAGISRASIFRLLGSNRFPRNNAKALRMAKVLGWEQVPPLSAIGPEQVPPATTTSTSEAHHA